MRVSALYLTFVLLSFFGSVIASARDSVLKMESSCVQICVPPTTEYGPRTRSICILLYASVIQENMFVVCLHGDMYRGSAI